MPTGTLRLNVPLIVASMILPPIVEGFLKTHPGITLEVTAEDSFIDVLAAGFDAGIRYDERLEQDMIAVPIGPRRQRFAAAAAPSYLAAHGRPAHPEDLLGHACLRHRFPSGVIPPWEFERGGEIVRISPKGPLIATTPELWVSAAVAGLGVICSFEEFLAPALSERPARPGARRLVAELLGAVPLLREPAAYAGTSARLCRLHQGAAGSQVKAVAYFT